MEIGKNRERAKLKSELRFVRQRLAVAQADPARRRHAELFKGLAARLAKEIRD